MAKLPAFQFYPGDWMKDADVRRCTIFARGLLMDLLCLCHESKRRGVLCEADGVTPWSNDDIVNALSGGTRDEMLKALDELERKGVLSRDENKCLYSRRMVRDEELRGKRADAGSAGGVAKSKQSSSKPLANDLAKPKQIPEDEDEDEVEEEIDSKKSGMPEQKMDGGYPLPFTMFWNSYPDHRRSKIEACFQVWGTALLKIQNKHSLSYQQAEDWILARIRQQAKFPLARDEFCPGCEKYLSDARFFDSDQSWQGGKRDNWT